MAKIRIGLVGVGYLGSIHLELLLAHEKFEVVGVFDRNNERCLLLKEKYPKIAFYDTYQNLLANVQAVGIIASTPSHFELAMEALQAPKAIFIEKPLCQSTAEATALLEAHRGSSLPFQVGHVERFNPAFQAFESFIGPAQIVHFESSRCAPFQERGADVSVVLDLLIHDIDLLLSRATARVLTMEVEAYQQYTLHPDEVTAHLLFEDGMQAKLFVSRCATQRNRSLTIKSKTHLFKLDLIHKTLEVASTAWPSVATKQVVEHNALQMQWQDFASAFEQQRPPKVDLSAGLEALDLALQIDSLARAFIAQNSSDLHNKKHL